MTLTIRMYNAGFGDCFLITIPAPDRPRKILIDCGKHTLSTTGPTLRAIVDAVLKDLTEDGEPRIDVLVVTHRHQDHVSGFAQKGWSDVRVEEVWMPWTEDPADPVARDICDRQSLRAARAHQGVAAMPPGASPDENAYLLGYAGNNLTNAAAMNLLHSGFQPSTKRRFLPTEPASSGALRTDVLPGVETYVFGPPRDPSVLREMDPPDEESFLRASASSQTSADFRSGIDPAFAIDRAQYIVQTGQTGQAFDDVFPVESEARLADIIDQPAMELLARLEQAVNSTSLVLLFHIGSAWLLFPGDAQWGTWNTILNNAAATKLLENLSFYKIGHHGSHNATPISFVDRFMKAGTLAMLPYGKVDKWPSIPRTALLDRLKAKQVIVARADEPVRRPFVAQANNAHVLTIDVKVKT